MAASDINPKVADICTLLLDSPTLDPNFEKTIREFLDNFRKAFLLKSESSLIPGSKLLESDMKELKGDLDDFHKYLQEILDKTDTISDRLWGPKWELLFKLRDSENLNSASADVGVYLQYGVKVKPSIAEARELGRLYGNLKHYLHDLAKEIERVESKFR